MSWSRGPTLAPVSTHGVETGGRDQETGWRYNNGNNLDTKYYSSSTSSVNAVSFGFVATAILISMFLVMAIFERFIRRPAPSQPQSHHHQYYSDLEAHPSARKLDLPSPKMSIYAKGVSVLMPGNEIPTFIAHPAPPPCPSERILWPSHLHSGGQMKSSS